jgi:hypothetical protein
MPIYQTTGTLTGTIERENVALAQEYLTSDDMTQFLEGSLAAKIKRIRWNLHSDGHGYHVEAIARKRLTKAELKELAEWVSGQNSDGLGEGFEQQSFAEDHEGECGECDGCENGYSCDDDYAGMISFDWKTNRSEFVQVA